MRFALMFKIDVLGTSRERHLQESLRRLFKNLNLENS